VKSLVVGVLIHRGICGLVSQGRPIQFRLRVFDSASLQLAVYTTESSGTSSMTMHCRQRLIYTRPALFGRTLNTPTSDRRVFSLPFALPAVAREQ